MDKRTTRYFAVIDVETNLSNQVMSIGVVIASAENFTAVDKKYYVLYPECREPALYSQALFGVNANLTTKCTRSEAMADLLSVLKEYNVKSLFAYNACFDYAHMKELNGFTWHDIMRVAPYRQYNNKIPADACGPSGRLRRGYGVEGVMRILMGWQGYRESHNALCDAIDELQIMQLLNQPLDVYPPYLPKQTAQPKNSSAHKHSDKLLSVDDCRYFIDEFYGGSVKLNNAIQKVKTRVEGEYKITTYNYLFDLTCCRCGYNWQQNIDDFIKHSKCPNCLGMGK